MEAEQTSPEEAAASEVSPSGASASEGGAETPAKSRVKKTTARKSSRRRKKTPRKRASKKGGTRKSASSSRGRSPRSFPAVPFEDALELALTMQRMGTTRVRRLTLFEELGRSSESGPSRQQITNSGRYGLTSGGYQAEWLELTDLGHQATNPDTPPRQRMRARYALAIENIQPFKALYDEFAGKKLPSQSVMRDFLREQGMDTEVQECIDTFIVNAKFVGLLRTIAGSERLLTLDHAADELHDPIGPPLSAPQTPSGPGPEGGSAASVDWSRVCFYVTPIGEGASTTRKHSDLFLASIVEPALQEFGLDVVRADQIGQAGMITAQIIEHLAQSRIVIADLSFHNPNVFYEVALRHALRRPIIQLIQQADRIPFDLDQVRTIRIDTTDIYSLVPQLETYRSEISSQVRRALDSETEVENPISVFYPAFWDRIGTG